MDAGEFSIAAGTIAAIIFVFTNVPMLIKAYRTGDLRSYSLSYLVLFNVGNVIYWIYVIALPLGPIWLMHGFYTVSMGIMLFWYLRFRRRRHVTPSQVGGLTVPKLPDGKLISNDAPDSLIAHCNLCVYLSCIYRWVVANGRLECLCIGFRVLDVRERGLNTYSSQPG